MSTVVRIGDGGPTPPKTSMIRRLTQSSTGINKPVVVQVKIECLQQQQQEQQELGKEASTVSKHPLAIIGSGGFTVQRKDNRCIISIPRSAVRQVSAPTAATTVVASAPPVIRVSTSSASSAKTRRLRDAIGPHVKELVAAQEGACASFGIDDPEVEAAVLVLPANTNTRKRYQCRVCHRCYARLEYLCRHVKAAHLRDGGAAGDEIGEDEEEEEQLDPADDVQVEIGDEAVDTGPKCTLCDRRFTTAEELRSHLSSHPGSYECPRCGRWFPSLSGLRRHTSEAHAAGTAADAADEYDLDELDEDDEDVEADASKRTPLKSGSGSTQSFARPCLCALCRLAFAESHQLANHVKSVHRLRKTGGRGDERCYKCAYCAKCFHQHTNLRRHLTCHTGQRQFPCPICQKRFADRGDVNKHMVTHTGVKPFKCHVCGRRFGQRTNLRTHAISHHHPQQQQQLSQEQIDAATTAPVARRREKTSSLATAAMASSRHVSPQQRQQYPQQQRIARLRSPTSIRVISAAGRAAVTRSLVDQQLQVLQQQQLQQQQNLETVEAPDADAEEVILG